MAYAARAPSDNALISFLQRVLSGKNGEDSNLIAYKILTFSIGEEQAERKAKEAASKAFQIIPKRAETYLRAPRKALWLYLQEYTKKLPPILSQAGLTKGSELLLQEKMIALLLHPDPSKNEYGFDLAINAFKANFPTLMHTVLRKIVVKDEFQSNNNLLVLFEEAARQGDILNLALIISHISLTIFSINNALHYALCAGWRGAFQLILKSSLREKIDWPGLIAQARRQEQGDFLAFLEKNLKELEF